MISLLIHLENVITRLLIALDYVTEIRRRATVSSDPVGEAVRLPSIPITELFKCLIARCSRHQP